MCLIVLSYHPGSETPVILAANRDEFYARPTARLTWWQDKPDILAGRDLSAGGTWLGVNRQGAFAAVTNYREPGKDQKGKKSRGLLVQNFLESGDGAVYAKILTASAADYNGFNLLFGDAQGVYYFSNRSGRAPEVLRPGLYGLSNHLLDTPWPKVVKSKRLFSELAAKATEAKSVFEILNDRTPAAEKDVPQTGLPHETERALSSVFITLEGYGTRVSSHLRIDASGEILFAERGYDTGSFSDDLTINFRI